MREWICGCTIVTALAASASAPAAEITLSCGSQELEVRLCEEAAAAWSAESGHQVVVRRGPEQSNQRYFEYLDLLEPQRRQPRRPADRRHLAERVRRPPGRPRGSRAARGRGPALRGADRQQHGRRPAGGAALVHRRRHPLLPLRSAGEIPSRGPRDLVRPSRRGAGDPGGRARGGQCRVLGPGIPGAGLRGPDLQRAGVDRRQRRRPDRRRRGQRHGQQPGGGAGAGARGELGRHRRAAAGDPVRRGGRADHLPARQRRVHAQLALRLGAAQRRGQRAARQGRGGTLAPRRPAGQPRRDIGRLAARGLAPFEEPGGRDRLRPAT